jgi:hypothetical protein
MRSSQRPTHSEEDVSAATGTVGTKGWPTTHVSFIVNRLALNGEAFKAESRILSTLPGTIDADTPCTTFRIVGLVNVQKLPAPKSDVASDDAKSRN